MTLNRKEVFAYFMHPFDMSHMQMSVGTKEGQGVLLEYRALMEEIEKTPGIVKDPSRKSGLPVMIPESYATKYVRAVMKIRIHFDRVRGGIQIEDLAVYQHGLIEFLNLTEKQATSQLREMGVV